MDQQNKKRKKLESSNRDTRRVTTEMDLHEIQDSESTTSSRDGKSSFFFYLGSSLFNLLFVLLPIGTGILTFHLLLYCQLSISNALRVCVKYLSLEGSIINSTINSFEATLDSWSNIPQSSNFTAITPGFNRFITLLHELASVDYGINRYVLISIPSAFFIGLYYVFSSRYYSTNVKALLLDSESQSEDLRKNKLKIYEKSVNAGSLVTSTAHAIMVVTMGLLLHTRSLISESHVAVKGMYQDKFQGESPLASFQITIAKGYFIWDILVSTWQFKIFGVGALLHSIAGLLAFFVFPCFNFGQYFISFCLIYEISTLPLNAALYLRDFAKNEVLSRIMGLLFGFSFIYIRLIRGYHVQKEAQKTANEHRENLMSIKSADELYEGNTIFSKFAKYLSPTKEAFRVDIQLVLYRIFSGINFMFWMLNVVWGFGVVSKILRGVNKLIFPPKTEPKLKDD